MSQSVKLKNGSYIDASGVWDNDRKETVEDALKCSTVYLKSYIEAAGHTADTTARADKQGNMVSLIFAAKDNNAEVAAKTVWCTLPEGYRPKGFIPVIASYLSVGATNLQASINSDGRITLSSAVKAGTWWEFAVTYLTAD